MLAPAPGLGIQLRYSWSSFYGLRRFDRPFPMLMKYIAPHAPPMPAHSRLCQAGNPDACAGTALRRRLDSCRLCNDGGSGNLNPRGRTTHPKADAPRSFLCSRGKFSKTWEPHTPKKGLLSEPLKECSDDHKNTHARKRGECRHTGRRAIQSTARLCPNRYVCGPRPGPVG